MPLRVCVASVRMALGALIASAAAKKSFTQQAGWLLNGRQRASGKQTRVLLAAVESGAPQAVVES